MCGESIKFVCIILSARDLPSQDFSLDILGMYHRGDINFVVDYTPIYRSLKLLSSV